MTAERPIVDCDVHPLVSGGMESLLRHMPSTWARRFEGRDIVGQSPFPPVRYAHPVGFLRADAQTPHGGPAGSDPEHLVSHHLDAQGVSAAVLLMLQAGALAAWVDEEEAAVLATAFNAHLVEEWLPVDARLHGCIVVAPHDPERAAEEIARWAGSERVVGVFLPLLGMLMGHRHYRPIHAAAAEHGLPVVIHGSGAEGIYVGAPLSPGGIPSTYVERYVDMPQIAQANVSSLVFEGTFERFPDLRVVFSEWGFSWAAALMWRMDKAWRGLRVEVPWVKRPPSDYVADHIRFTTEPIDEPPVSGQLQEMLAMIRADRTLMFSTDYPHWDNDTPSFVLSRIPREYRARVAYQNARELFGSRLALDLPAAA